MNTRLVFAVLAALLLPAGTEARFTLGGPQPPVLNIDGQVKFGPVLMLGAGEGEPWLSFENTAASLLFSGRLPGSIGYLVHPAMAGGRFTLLECYASWQPAEMFGVVAGQQKAPFGRVYNSSASRLLFGSRNPLAAFAPQYQLGVTPSFAPVTWLKLSAGAYNGNGPNRVNLDPGLLYAASFEITPLGPVPTEESAHRGYDEPVVALIPGFWTNREEDVLHRVTTTAYGAHAALRWQFLALDAAYYRRRVNTQVYHYFYEDDIVTTDGLTAQGGYAFAGRYEPIARFTMVGLTPATMTVEAGFNWYFNSYASRLGLNLVQVQAAGGEARRQAGLYYEYQF